MIMLDIDHFKRFNDRYGHLEGDRALKQVAGILNSLARHADVVVATGPVTEQLKEKVIRCYEQVPEPKFVVAVGQCAISGAIFDGSYTTQGGIDKVIPVNAYIPGCPPKPEAILDGVVKLLTSLTEG